MPDKTRQLTDKKLKAMEKKIAKTYKEAEKELTKKWNAYMKEMGEKLKNAEGDQLKALMESYTLRNDHYKAMVQSVTKDMAKVNQMALTYINGELPLVYSGSYSTVMRSAAKQLPTSFELVDQDTVLRMIDQGKVKTPFMNSKKYVNIPKDQRWNTKKINSSVLQGILQGESMEKIAKRILPIVDNNKDAAIRNARTLVNGAENAGRLDSYKNLREQGAILKKVWISTSDERTRDWHLELDGQEVELDDKFVDGNGNELEYPADPNAEPETVYNCRCTMEVRVIGFVDNSGEVVYVNQGLHDNNTLHKREVAEERAKRSMGAAEPKVIESFNSTKLREALSDQDYLAFSELVQNSENAGLYVDHADKIRKLERASSGGYYRHGSSTISFSIKDKEGMSKYGTIAHEYNHFFDRLIGSDLSYSEAKLINEKCWFHGMNVVKESASCSDEFLGALRSDMAALKSKGVDTCYKEFRTSGALRNATAGIQDALDGFFDTQKTMGGWGHGSKYYNRGYNNYMDFRDNKKKLKECYKQLGFDASNQEKVKTLFRQYEAASEAWANVGSAVTCGGAELEAMQKYMPKTLEAYKKIVKGK